MIWAINYIILLFGNLRLSMDLWGLIYKLYFHFQIAIDIPRTFPTNMFFKGNDPKSLEQPLFNVLLAFAQSNPQTGYCQGLNYVAGLILLVTRNEDTSFWLLKTLIEDILPDYYSCGLSGLLTDFKVLETLIE